CVPTPLGRRSVPKASTADPRPLEERKLLRDAIRPQHLERGCRRGTGDRRRTLQQGGAQRGRARSHPGHDEPGAHVEEGANVGKRRAGGKANGCCDAGATGPRRSTEETPPRQRGATRRTAEARGRKADIGDGPEGAVTAVFRRRG